MVRVVAAWRPSKVAPTQKRSTPTPRLALMSDLLPGQRSYPHHATSTSVRLPLDVAAQAWPLHIRDWRASEHGVERGTEILAGDGDGVARSAVVELAPVDQLPARIEEVEIGGAGSLISPGHILRLVVEVGERI